MCLAIIGYTPSPPRAAADHFQNSNGVEFSATSPIGRAKAAFGGRSRKGTPKQSFGYVAVAIRVRGYALSTDPNPSPGATLRPLPMGEVTLNSNPPTVATTARRANQQKPVQPLLQKYFA